MLRPATPADKTAILQMLERTFGRERDPRRWDWLFLGNTSSSKLYYYVAESNGTIVAQHATVPVRLTHAGTEIDGLMTLDAATDPDFQGRGLFSKLGSKLQEAARTERPLLFCFPNAASAPAFYNRLGWVELRPFPVSVRPLGNVAGPVRARYPALVPFAKVADATAAAGMLPARIAARRAERAGARVVQLDGFGDWADELWRDLRPHLGTATIRDARFLEWRFRASPFSYRLYGLERGAGPVGFAALSVRPWRGGSVADLMELMVRPGDSSGASALLAAALRDAWASGAVAVRAIVSAKHPHRRAFLTAGFVPLRGRLAAGYSFAVCVLEAARVKPNAVFHMDDWYISGADLDFI